LAWARAGLDTLHGRIETSWTLDGDLFELDVTVPEGVTATVRLPGADAVECTAGVHHHSTTLT
jgi:alpha-L-rhamnosidase